MMMDLLEVFKRLKRSLDGYITYRWGCLISLFSKAVILQENRCHPWGPPIFLSLFSTRRFEMALWQRPSKFACFESGIISILATNTSLGGSSNTAGRMPSRQVNAVER